MPQLLERTPPFLEQVSGDTPPCSSSGKEQEVATPSQRVMRRLKKRLGDYFPNGFGGEDVRLVIIEKDELLYGQWFKDRYINPDSLHIIAVRPGNNQLPLDSQLTGYTC